MQSMGFDAVLSHAISLSKKEHHCNSLANNFIINTTLEGLGILNVLNSTFTQAVTVTLNCNHNQNRSFVDHAQ